MGNKIELATFAAGCFWDVEETFRKVEGVSDVTVGYVGGATVGPTYKEVCSGKTGHAEAVQVVFNPDIVSYKELLDVFWESHDPTTLDRQGPDVGNQYRSAVFFGSESQKMGAQQSRKELGLSGKYESPIVTVIVPLTTFYKAEERHQRYLKKKK